MPGTYLKLPIDPQLAVRDAHLRFNTTVGARTFTFDLNYNVVGKFWVLSVEDEELNLLIRQKVVYGKMYNVDAYFVLAFIDPQGVEKDVTANNLGQSVIGAVGRI